MSKIKRGFEKVTLNSAKVLAKTQTGVDRVLWGKTAQVYSAKQTVSGSIAVVGQAQTASTAVAGSNAQKPKNPLDLGLFPILDVMASVDLCNISNYLLTQLGGPVPKKRPEKPRQVEQALYYIQDKTLIVQQYIDQFISYPNTIIQKYTSIGPEAITQGQAQAQVPGQPQGVQGTATGVQAVAATTTAETSGKNTDGTQVQKFNVANLIQYIKATFADGSITVDGKSIFTVDNEELLASVPGLTSNINIINDYINYLDRYTDYRNIPNEELQKILGKVNLLRTVCVTIQGLDFRDPRGFITALNFLPPSTVQAQAAKLQKWINPTQIIPTLKQINDAVVSFMRTVQQAQNVLTQGQFIIKLGTLFIKIFRIIVRFLKKLPIPNLYTTAGNTTAFGSICNKLEKFLDDLVDIIAQVNALLGVFISFLRYIIANSQELLRRLRLILDNLLNCNTEKDTTVVKQLDQTANNLATMTTQLQAYVDRYDARAKAVNRTAGKYRIEIDEEEITDKSITNKRRRGVALDLNGVLVAQSDLTFATDESIIIEEVRRKLQSLGLIPPGPQYLDDTIKAALDFLDDSDINLDDFSLPEIETEDPESENEDSGLGLQAFANKLRGGRRLRRRVRRRLDQARSNFRSQIGSQNQQAVTSLGIRGTATTATTAQQSFKTYEVSVYRYDVVTKTHKFFRKLTIKEISPEQAINAAREIVDEDNQYPNWKYKVRLI